MEIALHGHYGYRRLAVSSIPSILMMVVGSIYSVVDGLFVSNLVGTSAFAALNIIWPAVMIVGALGLMIGTGGSALVSQIMGQGDYDRANRVFSTLVFSTLGLAFLFMVPMLLLMEPLTRLLGAEGELLHLCVVYGSICTIGLPGFMLQMCFQSFYMTAEKPQLGTVMSLVCGVTNMALDALFIAVFDWGLAGAAAASMVACFVGGFYPLFYFSRRHNLSSLRILRAPFDWQSLLNRNNAAWIQISIAGTDGFIVLDRANPENFLFIRSTNYWSSGVTGGIQHYMRSDANGTHELSETNPPSTAEVRLVSTTQIGTLNPPESGGSI